MIDLIEATRTEARDEVTTEILQSLVMMGKASEKTEGLPWPHFADGSAGYKGL